MNAHEKLSRGAKMGDKRVIEVNLPLKEVSEESASEKSIRFGHISTLHIWWARKPLAASRATTYAALIPAPNDDKELRKKLKFIAELSKWENSLNQHLIKKAKKEIKDFFGDTAPKVLDCFAGGGAIPLEALRLSCETYALEYNPVAVLILKAVLEYPQKYSHLKAKVKEKDRTLQKTLKNEKRAEEIPKLVYDVKNWGEWVLKEAKKEIGKFYPPDIDGNVPIGYIWARTIRCQNPSCNAEIPLLWHFWLSKKENKKIALKMSVNKASKRIDLKIVKGKEIDFDPSQGTARRGTVLCPVCGAGMDNRITQRESQAGKTGERLLAVILHGSKGGKNYRLPTKEDVTAFKKARSYLKEKGRNWKWDYSPIPDEEIPTGDSRAIFVWLYGMLKWGDLFNDRQKLALISFVEKVRLAYQKMLEYSYKPEYAKAVATYLALALDRLGDKNANVVMYNVIAEKIEHVFSRLAIPMSWGYVEVNPFTDVGWPNMIDWILRVVKHCSQVSNDPAYVIQGTATRIPYANNFFDAVITDPPYYDNVPYSDLSDFFYVWLKRTVGDLYPELFSTPLSPKSQEIIQHPARHNNDAEKARQFFEDMLTQSFREIQRVLKPSGTAVILFTHKSTEAWETVINSLLKTGLVLTASWPLHTEKRGRLRAQKSAALASSIYMVCRKSTKEKIAYFNEIREEIENRIKEKLTQFWKQGISGGDFFVSAIGPAVEVFGRYAKVEKLSGEEVSVQELLEYVRKIVSEFALERVLKSPNLGAVDTETRFYLLWRWVFGNAGVPFDDAIKLSRPMGAELTDLWDGGGFVKKEKEFVRVLDPKERAKDPAFTRKEKFTSMIDVLHHVLILWEKEDKKKIREILDETGYLRNEMFWQTAQAISDVLPDGNKEKQLLQGLLYGKETYIIGERKGQLSLEKFVGKNK